MPPLAVPPSKPGSWPITVGAEGIAAAQFARCGFDVLVQSGHDKPWYDLLVTKAGKMLKIAIKASDDRRWNLAHPYLNRSATLNGKRIDCHAAIGLWLDAHGERTIYCLVQFEGVALNQLPRLYLATPAEIARKMRETAERLSDPILYERYEWTCPETDCTSIEALPSSWLFSNERIQELLFPQTAPAILMPPARRNLVTVEMRSKAADLAREDMREAVLTA
jgi:hypothetical protein